MRETEIDQERVFVGRRLALLQILKHLVAVPAAAIFRGSLSFGRGPAHRKKLIRFIKAVAVLARAKRVVSRPVEYRRQTLLGRLFPKTGRALDPWALGPGNVPHRAAGHDHGSGRRAHRPAPSPHVMGILKHHPFPSQAIEVGSLALGRTIATERLRRLIIGQDEQKIRSRLLSR